MTQVSILHLGNEVQDSGICRIIQHLVQRLGQRDYSWHIGGLRGIGEVQGEFSRLGMQIVDFSDRRNGSASVVGRIRDYVLAHQISIIHTHSPRTRLAAARVLMGTRRTLHLATEHLLYAPRDRRWGLIYTLLDRATLYLPDHTVAVSEEMHRRIVALPGLSSMRITAIRNAIDCESYYVPEQRDPCRWEFGLTGESLVIGFTGRMVEQKRLDLLLEGFSLVLARYPQAHLLIVGDGELRPELQACADSLDVSHAVTWTGFRRDIPRLLAAMDLYIQPSANEGLPLSLLEAMAAGKAVIATDVGGAQEALTHQETGILIPPESSQAIGTAIMDLLNHPEKRMALADAARDHVVQEFGVQRMVEGYLSVYESLASQL
ncbi:MAG: glycosyltransferase family 4 protein [Anaerolineae bacterium]